MFTSAWKWTWLIRVTLGFAGLFPMANATVITGLEGTVTAVAFSPDGKTLAAADGGFALSLWDVSRGSLKTKFNGLATGTNRVCWSPNGELVYGTSGNDWIAWEAATGKERRKVAGAMTRTAPAMIALSRDGQLLAAAGRSVVKLWNTSTGAALGEYEAHPNYALNSVTFSPDGRYVATTSNDRNVQLTETASGTAGATFACGSKLVAAEFSPDGSTIFAVDQTPTLHQIDVASGSDTPAAPLARVPKQIAVSPDGQLVACAGSKLYLWSRHEGRWYERRIEDSSVGPTAVAFSPDGQWLACGDAEGRIHLWKVAELTDMK